MTRGAGVKKPPIRRWAVRSSCVADLEAIGVEQVAALVVTLGAQRVGDRASLLGVVDDGLDEGLDVHVGVLASAVLHVLSPSLSLIALVK